MARFEMALHNELFVTLIVYLSCFIPSHAQDYYSITRTSSLTYDVFQVPRCLKPCSSYVGANTHDSSSCKCACKYESSTFGIHNSVWMCQKNAFSRTQAGCTFYVEGNDANKPVEILPSSVGNFKIIFPALKCKIQYSSSQYRQCDGTWTSLDSLLASPGPFSIFPIIEPIVSSGNVKYRYTIKISSDISKFAGQLITLSFKCKSTSSCVLLKVAGPSKCPFTVPQPGTTTAQSSTTPSTAAAVTTPTTTSSSAGSEVVPTTQRPQTTTAVRPGYSTTQSPGRDSPRDSSQESTSTGVVAAVVVVVIIVIIIGVILGYIFWKRKKGENVWLVDRMSNLVGRTRRSTSRNNRQNEPEESIYAEIPDRYNNIKTNTSNKDRGVYKFAFEDPKSGYCQAISTDGDSLYEEAVDNVINGRHAHTGGLMNGFIANTDEQQYEGLRRGESDNDQGSDDQPEYNVLEDPNEPEYKELEKPDQPVYTDLNNPDQPEYNVLENPNSPPYNEIDNPKSPVYNEVANPNSPPYKELTDPKLPIYNEPYGPKSPEYNTIEDAKNSELTNRGIPRYLSLLGPNDKPDTSKLNSASSQISTSDSELVARRNRRRPPSPPRRTNDTVSNVILRDSKGRGNSKNDEHNEENRTSVYEPLQNDIRPSSVYEPLDNSTLSREC